MERTDYLNERIESIREDVLSKKWTKQMLEARHNSFFQEHPFLFAELQKRDCDIKMIRMMLEGVKSIETKTTTQLDASAVVGKVLLDKYYTPPK
jgi:hypothetical protein